MFEEYIYIYILIRTIMYWIQYSLSHDVVPWVPCEGLARLYLLFFWGGGEGEGHVSLSQRITQCKKEFWSQLPTSWGLFFNHCTSLVLPLLGRGDTHPPPLPEFLVCDY